MNDKALNFKPDGSFKIMQFTDVHYNGTSPEDEKTLKLMERLIEAEAPDLIALTGDVATCERNTEAICGALRPVIASGIPWMFQFGNHDTEYGKGYDEMLAVISTLPGNLTCNDETSGFGKSNYYVSLKSADGGTRWVLFGVDSNAYFGDKTIGGYDFIHKDQIEWYVRRTAELEREIGEFGSLVFMHMPLPEYYDVWNYEECRGEKLEGICAPYVNSGMFAAMLASGHTRGVFVGHDHINDYIGDLFGIKLAYGRATGYNTYSAEGYMHGARVIVLKENDTKNFDTYIVLEDGSKPEQKKHMPEMKRI